MNTMKAAALILLALATSTFARPPHSYESDEYVDNNVVNSIPLAEHEVVHTYDEEDDERTEYVEISLAPKKDIYYPSEPIEAECRVTGSPVPQVEWVHGSSGSLTSEDFETNMIMERSPSGIATVVAKLIIKPHHIPQSGTKRTYTCVGKSGGKIVKASTTVHFNHQNSEKALGANDMFKTLTGSEKVKIYEYYENLFDYIGSSVFLPCKATPKAEVYWINEEGKVITGQESRFKVLPTGELLITNLQFKDVGTYICLAKNGVSKDVASTFVYALAHKK